MKLSSFIFALCLLGYLAIFSLQEQQISQIPASISPPLPAIVQRATLGFFKELAAEMLFVKSAVFYGGRVSSVVVASNADSLSLNLDVATSLYPQFIDPYYLCQATLPHISPKYAAIANDILAHYDETEQENIIIPFYRGFNFFYYMDNSLMAAEVFDGLALREDAPSWYGHLAGILTARGGNLYAGLVSLQSMLSVEMDELRRERYLRDISIFNQAIIVHKATDDYYHQLGSYPEKLTQLVPQFLESLPKFDYGFSLQWEPPDLRLLRPLKKGDLN